MQLVLSKNRIIAHGENFLPMGSVVINTMTGAKYENATIAECDVYPSDLGEVGYEYHAGVFVPCAPYGKTEDGSVMVACECGTPRKSGWMLSELVPVGTILWYTVNVAPKGFLICDGSMVAKEYYPALWSKIGDTGTFGTPTSTHFYLPDLRAKFIRGRGFSADGKYEAPFAGTQEATFITGENGALSCTNGDYVGSEIFHYKLSGVGVNEGMHGFAVRPYNIALLPIIKY